MLIVGITADRTGQRAALLSAAVFVLAAFFLTAATTFSYSQGMTLPGSAGVGASGGATYNIPIVVPPGAANMAPSLGLSYSSQGGNSSVAGGGIVGMGWSLDGLPSITRCGRSVAQDGAYGGINFDANDRFCMDGQRLMVISGAYGADGAEYRTEIETFSKIISHGTAGVGPAWFEVRTKSGQVMEFGNTADSRVLAQGKAVARSWALNKLSDVKTNYFTVTYVNDNANGQAYPSRIDYTGNPVASRTPYNSVQFVYNTARPDITPAYHQGSLIQTKVLLTNVKTYAGATLVGDYRLVYQQGSATGRSQLASVTLCGGSGNCMPGTTFAWQNGATAPGTVIANVAGQNGAVSSSRPYVADLNGDGLSDIMWDDGVGNHVLWAGNGAGGFSVNGNFLGQNGALVRGPPFTYVPIIADFNRDGRPDIWWYTLGYGYSTTKWLSTNNGSFAVSAGPDIPHENAEVEANPLMPFAAFAADVNGDGRADLVWMDAGLAFANFPGDTSGLYALKNWIMGPGGAVTSVTSNVHGQNFNNPGDEDIRAAYDLIQTGATGADFNGDGILDFVYGAATAYQGSQGKVYFGQGNGNFTLVRDQDPSLLFYVARLGDLNGDGKTDILWDRTDNYGRSSGTRILWLSKGDGTFTVVGNPGGGNGTLAGYVPYSADFNGDGKTDLFWDQTDTNGVSTGARVLWLSAGDGTFTIVSNPSGQNGTLAGYVPLIADFNADGKADVIWNNGSGARTLWLSDGVPPDVMTGATTGLGVATTFTYKPLTEVSIYTKDNTAVDPITDLQGGMLVVSRVDTSDGVGGTKSLQYTYAGAKADQNGRGFLGFRQISTRDLQTNMTQTTTYRQDYPYAGMIASEVRSLNGAPLSTTTNSFGATNLGGTRYQVFMTQSQIASNDLDGAPLPTATSTYQFDAFGNATQIVTSHSDGFSKTTTNTYTNDTTRWLLGRLTRASVAAQAPP